MKLISTAAAVLLAGAVLPASASLITLHTRASGAAAPALGSDAANGAYYRDTVSAAIALAPTAGHCDATLASLADTSNHGNCGGGVSNLAFGLTIDFGLGAAQAGDFSLRIGPDFGKGGAVFLDGLLLGVRTSDMWWAGSWNAPSQIFQFLNLTLTQGNHQLAIFGLEGCCDGGQQAQFRIGSGAWTTFSSTDPLVLGAAAASVPEPPQLALVLSALLGTAGATLLRRRQLRA
ncbi:MAG: CCXG family PEP-CTERM protein [Burkholderiales bacterium]|nr:CCXG family PEP-CTERM protein [Burkholderiales bacterium]